MSFTRPDILAYRSYYTTFVYTLEVVEKKQFLLFLPYFHYYVLGEYVGNEVLRKPSRIDDSLTRLFYVFQNISHCRTHFTIIVYLLKVASTELFVEIRVLHGNLSLMSYKTKIVDLG